MNEFFDRAASKENIVLELNTSLLAQAKAYGINLDEAVESALIREIQRHLGLSEIQNTGSNHV